MKRLVIICIIAALAGCGVETLGTAATGAAIKKKELEEGKKTMDRARQQVEQATQQAQERTEKSEQ